MLCKPLTHLSFTSFPYFLFVSIVSRYDCGIFAMLYMEYWGGKKISIAPVCVFFHSSSFFLSLMPPMFLWHFPYFLFCPTIFSQVMMVDNRKHDISLLLLSQINKILMDDFVKEHCSTCIETSLIISNSLVNIFILCILYLGLLSLDPYRIMHVNVQAWLCNGELKPLWHSYVCKDNV